MFLSLYCDTYFSLIIYKILRNGKSHKSTNFVLEVSGKKLPFLSDGYQKAPTSYGPKRPTAKVNEASLQEKKNMIFLHHHLHDSLKAISNNGGSIIFVE